MHPPDKPLSGIVPPMATPLLDAETLDREALHRHADRLIKAGVSGLFVLGTTGEAPGLSYTLRNDIIALVCAEAEGRVPVLVSITDTAFEESLIVAHAAAEKGAHSLVLAAPFYYSLSQSELLDYFERLIPRLPLPVFLYNIPSHVRICIAPETARRLADLKQVLGIKDSSGDSNTLKDYVAIKQQRSDFAVFCGPEEMLLEAVRQGADGGIAGGSNLWPRLYLELYRAAVSGNWDQAAKLQTLVLEISERIYHQGENGSSYLRGMKCALAKLAGCNYVTAEPYRPFDGEIRERIEQAVDDIGSRMKF